MLRPSHARPPRARRPLLVVTLLGAVVVPCAVLASTGPGRQPETLVAAGTGVVTPTTLTLSDVVPLREPSPAASRVAAPHRALARAARTRRLPRPATPAVAARPVQVAAPSSGSLAQRVLAEARRHRGAPYRYGAAGPSRFDCSGFTMYVFGRFGISLPHSSSAQASVTRRIPDGEQRPGDLIFTYHGGSIGHVGIYAGGTLMWAAVKTGDVVRLEDFGGRAYSVGRVG